MNQKPTLFLDDQMQPSPRDRKPVPDILFDDPMQPTLDNNVPNTLTKQETGTRHFIDDPMQPSSILNNESKVEICLTS